VLGREVEESEGGGVSAETAKNAEHWPQDGDIYERKTEHWLIRREVVGVNGSGCPWLKQHWIWPSGETCRTDTLTLNHDETLQMIESFQWVNAPAVKPPDRTKP
jgi:hypothetical protein